MVKNNNRNKRKATTKGSLVKMYTPNQINSLWTIVQSIRTKNISLNPIEGTIIIENTDNPTIKTYTREQIVTMGQIAAKHMRWNIGVEEKDNHHVSSSKTKVCIIKTDMGNVPTEKGKSGKYMQVTHHKTYRIKSRKSALDAIRKTVQSMNGKHNGNMHHEE